MALARDFKDVVDSLRPRVFSIKSRNIPFLIKVEGMAGNEELHSDTAVAVSICRLAAADQLVAWSEQFDRHDLDDQNHRQRNQLGWAPFVDQLLHNIQLGHVEIKDEETLSLRVWSLRDDSTEQTVLSLAIHSIGDRRDAEQLIEDIVFPLVANAKSCIEYEQECQRMRLRIQQLQNELEALRATSSSPTEPSRPTVKLRTGRMQRRREGESLLNPGQRRKKPRGAKIGDL